MLTECVSRRGLLLALPFAGVLHRVSAADWDSPVFPDWSDEFVDKVLTDSPWAHRWKGTATALHDPQPAGDRLSSEFQVGIGMPSPIPGVGWPRGGRIPGTGRRDPGSVSPLPRDGNAYPLRTELDLIVRWASALPVRRARAINSFGRRGVETSAALELLADTEKISIELAGLPHILASDRLKRELGKTRLQTPGRRAMTPVSVDIPTMGTHVTATLVFLRPETVPVDNGGAFLIDLQSQSLRLEESFRLKSMSYQGRLEL